MKIVKVGPRNSNKGRNAPTLCVTIPEELRKIAGFKTGDNLMVIAEKGKLTYKKITDEG